MNLEKLRAVRSRQVAAGHRRDGLGSYREFDDSSKLLDGRQCRDDSEVASGCDLPLGKRAQCVMRVSRKGGGGGGVGVPQSRPRAGAQGRIVQTNLFI